MRAPSCATGPLGEREPLIVTVRMLLVKEPAERLDSLG